MAKRRKKITRTKRKLSPVRARVRITLKPGVFDPQGKEIMRALAHLGFTGIEDVRLGKILDVTLLDTRPDNAAVALQDMCSKSLVNSVIEDYQIEIEQPRR